MQFEEGLWFEKPLAGNRLLYIEDNPADAEMVKVIVNESTSDPFEVEHVDRLGVARERLIQSDAPTLDVILLDLGLPDSQGMSSLLDLIPDARHTPIVVLIESDDDKLGNAVVQAGAEDFIRKSQIEIPGLLSRTLKYAIMRSLRNQAQQREEANESGRRLNFDLVKITAVENDMKSLRFRETKAFREMVESYLGLMLQNDITHDLHLADAVLERLIKLDGEPTDLVDLHSTSLLKAESEFELHLPGQQHALRERSRTLALTMMARLLILYRDTPQIGVGPAYSIEKKEN